MKSIFDLTPKELKALLLPVAEEAVNRAHDDGMPITYLNSDQNIDAKYVDKSPGRLDYLNIDQHTGKDIIIASKLCSK